MISLLLIALSLALDAGAAAVCCGLSAPGFRLRDGVRVGLWFGLFQGGMTLAGALAGSALSERFTRLTGVLSFGLLLWLGIRMILDALSSSREAERCTVADLSAKTLAALAVATSLDALAVGVSVTFLHVELWIAAAVIGGVAFSVSLLGSLAGRQLGRGFHRTAGCLGGGVLIVIGIKILLGL